MSVNCHNYKSSALAIVSFILNVVVLINVSFSADLQCFENVQWIDNPGNDGDSFLVQFPTGQQFRVRLYYVDTPETSSSWESDVRRIRTQQRHFGLPESSLVVQYGRDATVFTKEQLQQPFTVYTAFADALGRSRVKRIYSFVETARHEDLATLLVKNGFARAYGVGRETPHGISRDEMKARLEDLEAAAMLRNVGIWEQSDPERLGELRAQQREEDKDISSIRKGVKIEHYAEMIPVNSCTMADLQSIHGIGPALAERIVAGRPYKELNDLRTVRGVSTKRLEEWCDQLSFQ